MLYGLIGFVQHKLFTTEKKFPYCVVKVYLRFMWSSFGAVNITLESEDEIGVLPYRRTTLSTLCTSHLNVKKNL